MLVFECKHNDKILLVLFYGQETPILSVKSDIKIAYQNRLKPDGILFLYPSYISKHVDGLFDDSGFKNDISRYGGKVFVQAVNFNKQGELSLPENQCIGDCFERNDSSLLVGIVNDGMDELVKDRKEQILAKSPPGTVFTKPSGKRLEEFIYASHLARSYSENQFLAFCLLSKAPDIDSIDWIYIDTAGISAIAEAIVYYIHRFEQSNCKRVKYKSFSSYSGLEDARPDETDNIWVIISASASTSMGKKMKKIWGMQPEQIVTILSYKKPLSEKEENIGNDVLFCVSKHSTKRDEVDSPIKVEVKGENFTAEVDVSRSITIRKKHKPRELEKAIEAFKDDNIFDCHKRAGEKTREVFVNFEELINIKEPDVKEWLEKVIMWHFPSNIEAIVVDDKASKFVKILKTCLDKKDSLNVLDMGELRDAGDRQDGTVVILSSVITSGRFFLDVNRELRLNNHNGMRLFLSGYTLSNSRNEFVEFKKSLTFAPDGFTYLFFDYLRCYMDSNFKSSWTDELKFLNNRETLNDFWQERKSILEQEGEGLNGLIGVRHGGAGQKLTFSKDFAFWGDNQKVEDIRPEAVYFTIASILQNLRDSKGEGTLKSSVYQHSVLSPDNFIRFNDPLIQSCLWRAALPTELDYRMSDKLSADMAGIMVSLIQSYASGRGEVALDLLLGLRLGRIKLTAEDNKRVQEKAREIMNTIEAVNILIHND